MANNYYEYVYYIDGDKIALLQKVDDIQYDPYIDFGDEIYSTPSVSQENAVELVFQPTVSAPADEQTELSVSRQLARAIACYVGARLIEDEQPALADRKMREFYKLVQQEARNLRVAMPTGAVNFLGAIK